MEPLLIVLVVGCALVSAVHIGRGVWARSRSVERHHQALDTLADITQSSGPPSVAAGPVPQPVDGHQAHVRIIRPGEGLVPARVLPPPRPSFAPRPSRPSPFRKPSRAPGTWPSGTWAGLEGADRTLPGRAPPLPPLPVDERSTRPVPVAQAQVFFFDDLGVGRNRPAAGAAGQAAPQPEPTVFNPDSVAEPGTGIMLVPGTPAVGAPSPGVADAPALPRRPRLSPRSILASALAAAAVCVGLAAVGLTLNNGNGARAATPGSSAHKRGTVPQGPASGPRRPLVTRTVPPTTTPTTVPVVADLISSSVGAATYHISSAKASIVVRAKGPCWLEVRADSPSGQVVYEGTLEAGQRSSVTGPAWLRLGDPPQVTVSVNGKRLGPPGAQQGAPLNLEFTLGKP